MQRTNEITLAGVFKIMINLVDVITPNFLVVI